MSAPRRLAVFNHISLDGYFTDRNNDMSWAHKQDPEWDAYSNENAQGGGLLVFGRITYELMASYWPTPRALSAFPEVAAKMNNTPKVVFSKTLKSVSWQNTELVNRDPAEEIRERKSRAGEDMVILGSGMIVAQLAAENLIDEYQLVSNPLALGAGRTLFEGLKRPLHLHLRSSRAFTNGNVVLTYDAVKS